ncbi:aspartate kinase [Candidatus Woesearchaeota archaeon]|nr:aspartate kinase [Candidatus Woesearchaeota archaeon]
MIILKFGGSSVANAERIKEVAALMQAYRQQHPVIVLSAMGDTTDHLLAAGHAALHDRDAMQQRYDQIKALHQQTAQDLGIFFPLDLLDSLKDLLQGIHLLGEFSPKTRDTLMSFGERLSVRMVAAYIASQGIAAKSHDAWDLGFMTNNSFGHAEILDESFPLIENSFSMFKHDFPWIPVVTGFLGKDRDGNITTLGRGGSDLTACVLAAALHADEVIVWKDVDGILTTDPRLVKEAKSIPAISFEEAAELAYFGAQVLQPGSLLPAMKLNIPVRVKNSYNVQHPGTVIVKALDDDAKIRAITFKKHVILVDLVSTRMLGQSGFLQHVFQVFANLNISVDVVATSEVSISLTLDQRYDIQPLKIALEKIAHVTINEGKTIMSLIGNVRHSSEILAESFAIMQQLDINVQMISQGASKVNISMIVDDAEGERCITALHRHFFGGKA